jgi:hypothetical protein
MLSVGDHPFHKGSQFASLSRRRLWYFARPAGGTRVEAPVSGTVCASYELQSGGVGSAHLIHFLHTHQELTLHCLIRLPVLVFPTNRLLITFSSCDSITEQCGILSFSLWRDSDASFPAAVFHPSFRLRLFLHGLFTWLRRSITCRPSPSGRLNRCL